MPMHNDAPQPDTRTRILTCSRELFSQRSFAQVSLKDIAAAYGVDASAMRKKSDVIAAIEAAKAGQTDDDGTDDEEPPQIGAADPV